MVLYRPHEQKAKMASIFKGHNLKTTRLPKISSKSALGHIKLPKMPKAKMPKIKL